MNLEQYLSNPVGKGSAIIPANSIKEDLNNQFQLLQSKMSMEMYKNDKVLIFKIKLPSRNYDKVSYDIIIEYNLKDIANNETINSVPFRCFSNCPSFIYTYAYIFDKKDLLCPWLKNKYSREVMEKRPETRNEYEIVSFERSLYLSLKYISLLGRNKMSRIDLLSNSFRDYPEISRHIKTDREIMYKINTPKEKEKVKKKEEKVVVRGNTKNNYRKNGISKTKTTKTTSAISPDDSLRIKNSKKTKKI